MSRMALRSSVKLILLPQFPDQPGWRYMPHTQQATLHLMTVGGSAFWRVVLACGPCLAVFLILYLSLLRSMSSFKHFTQDKTVVTQSILGASESMQLELGSKGNGCSSSLSAIRLANTGMWAHIKLDPFPMPTTAPRVHLGDFPVSHSSPYHSFRCH